jgi:c-di-GMP-binding flagellar brake protein YcgR
MSVQKRKSTRLDSDQFISYRLFDQEGNISDEGMAKTTDISRSGVAIENRRSFELDSKVELTIALSDELIKAEAIVRNVKELEDDQYLIGLEFASLSSESFEKLKSEFPNIVV